MLDFLTVLIVFFGAASIVLYVILGGADYGAGILEFLPSRGWREMQRDLVNSAIGPVWEANHIWLIILIVILFTGFPSLFHVVMVSLHLPILALLVGIVVRGAAFAFRHYDPAPNARSLKIYTIVFSISSIWAAFWIGVTASSVFRGLIDPQATDFWSAYIAPWWGAVPLAMGLFVTLNCAYLASLFLIGECDDPEFRTFLIRRGFVVNLAMAFSGGLVFLASYFEGDPFFTRFLHSPIAGLCMIVATFLFIALWMLDKTRFLWTGRLLAAAQTAFILFAWYLIHAPHLLATRQGWMDIEQTLAPPGSLLQLAIALIVGSFFIFPSLIFLLYVFKRKSAIHHGH